MTHIWRHPDAPVTPPAPIEWRGCVHLPTLQRYAILDGPTALETERGTMSGAAGDYLVESVDGKQLYILSPAEFAAAYQS